MKIKYNQDGTLDEIIFTENETDHQVELAEIAKQAISSQEQTKIVREQETTKRELDLTVRQKNYIDGQLAYQQLYCSQWNLTNRSK